MASPKRTLPGIPGIVQKDDARNLGSCLVVVSAMTAAMIMVMATMMTTMFP
jgi:predicted ribosome-associated RNA-binding protein Tma20